MPQAATTERLPRAGRVIKAMQAQGTEWGEDCRHAAGAALKDALEDRMASGIDRHLANRYQDTGTMIEAGGAPSS